MPGVQTSHTMRRVAVKRCQRWCSGPVTGNPGGRWGQVVHPVQALGLHRQASRSGPPPWWWGTQAGCWRATGGVDMGRMTGRRLPTGPHFRVHRVMAGAGGCSF